MAMLSVLIITKNEELHLEDALESVAWADEIVVVDSGSTDKTVEIAKKYTKKVFHHDWPGYSEQKNWGAGKCSHDWILSIDADERATPELRVEIESALKKNDANGYYIPTKDFMFGKWILYGGWYPQEHIRLYKKAESSWGKHIHEVVKVDGQVGHLKNPILHYGHTDMGEFIGKLNTYTQKEADDRYKKGESISVPRILFTMLKTFIGRYIKHRGYLDGFHGFILAVFMVFYNFSSDIKLWELHYMARRKNDGVETT